MTLDRRSARLQKLPLSEIAYLNSITDVELLKRVAALYSRGWTLASIGEAFLPARGRSTVKAWVDRSHQYPTEPALKPVPSPSHKTDPRGYQRLTPKSPGVPKGIAEQLSALAPLARNYRARMSSATKEYQANEEMDRIVRTLRIADVSIADIARAAGVTHRAIAKRLEKEI